MGRDAAPEMDGRRGEMNNDRRARQENRRLPGVAHNNKSQAEGPVLQQRSLQSAATPDKFPRAHIKTNKKTNPSPG
jgi:hypothetical protein